MIAADLTDTHIVVDIPRRAASLVQEIPGSRYDARTERWTLPRTLNALVQLYGQTADHGLELSPELAERGALWKDAERRLEDVRQLALDPDEWSDCDGLRGYQVPAVRFLHGAGSAILGDDKGTGKTVMAMHWLGTAERTLIVAPRGVFRHWMRHLQRYYPEREHMVLPATAAKRRKAFEAYMAIPEERRGALIVAYSQLPLHSRLAPYGSVRLAPAERELKELNAVEWRSVIADEAHRAFHPQTKHTRALWWLADHAERKLALTGDPSESSPIDFWALLRLVAPDEWPSRVKFQEFYCETVLNFWGGAESIKLRVDMAEQFHRLANRRFLRRTKALVLPHLPRKVYEQRMVELPPKLRKQYDDLRKEMVAEVESGTLTIFDPIALHSRLIQAASAQLEVTGQTVDEDGTVHDVVRMCEPSPKVDALIEAWDDLGRAPLAAFAASRQLLELASARLEKLGIGHVKIVGGMDEDDVENARNAFNEGVVNVLLVSVGAMAEGWELTRGSLQIWLDRSYLQRMNGQAEDRQHGSGRGDEEADHLLIIDLVSVGTVEERRMDRLEEKAENFAELFPDPATFIQEVG